MRVLFLGNNWLGLQILQWLKAEHEEIVGVVLHPPKRQRYGYELIAAADAVPVFDGSRLREPNILESIRKLGCDIAVSVLFGYILRPDFLKLAPSGCINLHPSLLPYNRGAHPNVWSIIEGTPAGATLHYIDEGIDTGDIIAQREVAVESIDTGETLYRRLEWASLELFKETWPNLRDGSVRRFAQSSAAGTSHHVGDLERIDEIDLEASYKAKDLINLIRARTFSPYPGAYFRSNGRKVFLRLELAHDQPGKS